MRGRASFDALLAEPEQAHALLAELSPRAGSFLIALFNPETLRHHARKQRMLASQLVVRGRPQPSARAEAIAGWARQVARRLWSSFDRMDLLRDAFTEPPEASGSELDDPIPERWPSFVLDGVRLRVDAGEGPSDRGEG